MSDLNVQTLADFGQLRTAQTLTTDQRRVLAEELVTAMGPFAWFTVGVMASSDKALEALRALERSLQWEAMA